MEDAHHQKGQVLSFNDESSPVENKRTRAKIKGSSEFRKHKDNDEREVKECTLTNSSQRKRGRPKKSEVKTDVQTNAKEKESQKADVQTNAKEKESQKPDVQTNAKEKESHRPHSLKRKIHDHETLNEEKKKLLLSPHKLLSLKELVNAAIVSKNTLNQSETCSESEPEQHEIEAPNPCEPTLQDKTLEVTEKSENVKRRNKNMNSIGENSCKVEQDHDNTSQECTSGATDVCEEDDDKQQMHQPLSLVDACVQQLHRGVDERSYLLLMNRGLNIGNHQNDSEESKVVTSSTNTAVDDGSSLESSLDSCEQLSSTGCAEKTSSQKDQDIASKCEGFEETKSSAVQRVLYQNKPKPTDNRNLFNAIMSVENQMMPDNVETKNAMYNNDACMPMDYSTSARRNSQFSDSSSQFSQPKSQFSGVTDSARSYLFKDRDEESLLAAELLTRLPHGRIVDNDSHNSVIKLSDIQPTILMEGNPQTHYFDQSLAMRGPHTNSTSNNGPNPCCYGNMVASDNANIGLITGGRIHDNIVSDFSVPSSHLQTVTSIPSACSAFSPLQHSSPANNITASDILYQTNGFNSNTTQGQWNQNEGRRHSFPGVELPMEDSDALHSRRSDPGLGHMHNWNSMTLENTANTDQMQTVINQLTNPRQQPLLHCQGQQVMASQGYNYDQILPENGLYDTRQSDSGNGYMNQNSELHENGNFFERRDSSGAFRNCTLPNYNSNVDDHNNLVELQEGVQMLESISANIADCDMMNTGSTQNTNPGHVLSVQEPSLHAELDHFSKSVGGQMQYFQPLNLKDNFDTQSNIQKRRRRSKTSKTRGSFQNEPEYLDFFNEVVYKGNQGSYESALQSLHSRDIDKDKFYVVLAPMVNPAEVNDIGHNGLIARYIDYLIVENEQITEMSKAVSIPIEHCVMDDPYLMDIIRVKVPFPTTKYYQWLRTFYPNIPIDWKALHRQMLHFHPMGDCRQQHYMIDKRPTPVLLGESFYFFQRERDRLLPC